MARKTERDVPPRHNKTFLENQARSERAGRWFPITRIFYYYPIFQVYKKMLITFSNKIDIT